MNTSLGSNKKGGASADSSAITRMRKLAAIASNYNQPSKQQRFPAGVVSVGLANSALQVFQNTTKGVAPPKSSFRIIPIGLGDTTQTLDTVPAYYPLIPSSAGFYIVYGFTAPASTNYTFRLTPTIQNEADQVITFSTSGTNILTEALVLDPSSVGNPLTYIGSAKISAPVNYTLPSTQGDTYYFVIYSFMDGAFNTTPQTYTLNIA